MKLNTKLYFTSEQRIFFLVLLSSLPVIFLLMYVFNDPAISLLGKVIVLVGCGSWVFLVAISVKRNFVYHLRTLSNLVEAIRTEDYSMRSRRVREPGELAELYQQIDTLTTKLKDERRDEFELSSLLEKIVNQIDVAIIACDSDDRIRVVNRLATQLFDASPEQLIGLELKQTPFSGLLEGPESNLVDFDFPGASGRWQINVVQHRHQGKPGKLIFITDLKQVLGEQEILAWQRLIRVIAHEINNSLTPISSICQTLDKMLSENSHEICDSDLREGLAVIQERARGLKEFISVYARIAKLPEPQKVTFQVRDVLQKVKGIFQHQPIVINENLAEVTMFGDPVHIEQVLINLIKNAIEASDQQHEPVVISCIKRSDEIVFEISDSGAGISNPANLFIPFYTTKDKGAGIGLTLCRQIAARHGGQVILENRIGQKGAVAKLLLPVSMN